VHARAARAGVTALVVPAVERANFGAVASVCRDYAGCHAAYGIHPLYVGRALDEDVDALRALLQREPAVAIGEIGLDFHVEDADRERQQQFFVAQLQLAAEFDLPVLLHTRRAVDATLMLLRRHRVPGGIAHAFSGSRQQAEEFLRLGFKLGFGGAMTHVRASRLRALAASLPLEAIVLETDAPDIPPAWLTTPDRCERSVSDRSMTSPRPASPTDARRNEPAELAGIASVLAELRSEPLARIVAAIAGNTHAVLPKLALQSSPGLSRHDENHAHDRD